jgi:hypothetical protein
MPAPSRGCGWRRRARRRGRRARACDRRALAGHGGLVAADDRAGEGVAAAERRPVLDGGADERDERRARDAGRGGEALGGGLDRREEVRRDRGGGVVGGAVLVGDAERVHAEVPGQGTGGRLGPRRRTGDRGARAGELPAGMGDGRQGMEAEGLVRGEDVEAGGAGAVADEAAVAGGDRARRGGDLAVGHAEEHDVRVRAVGAAPERACDGVAGGAQRTGQRRAEAAAADDRDRALHISVQPPHCGVPVALLYPKRSASLRRVLG